MLQCSLDALHNRSEKCLLNLKDNYIDCAHARSISACNVLLTVRVLFVMPPKDLANDLMMAARP